jgi:NADPH:quinone reductase-like Zn-dependent oxidoreductase
LKAFVRDRYGKQRALQLTDVPVPALRDDEVLVEVHAAGVNLLDAKIRNGEFKLILRYGMPLVLGHDVAGVVAKVYPFASTNEALAHVEGGRAKGKVVVSMR